MAEDSSWGAGETNFCPAMALGKGLPYGVNTPLTMSENIPACNIGKRLL